MAADTAGRLGLRLPARARTPARARGAAAGGATPGTRSTTRRSCGASASGSPRSCAPSPTDPGVDQLLLLHDEPEGLAGAAARAGTPCGPGSRTVRRARPRRRSSPPPSPSCCPTASAASFLARGLPAVAGLRTALACARRSSARPAIRPGCARSPPRPAGPVGRRATGSTRRGQGARARAGLTVPARPVVTEADAAVAAAEALRGPVAVKASAAALRHKSEAGGVMLGSSGRGRGARGLRARRGRPAPAARVLVEAMAPPGVELRRRRAARRGRPGARRRPRRDLDRAARRRRGRPAAGDAGAGRGGAAVAARRRAAHRRARAAAGRPRGARRGSPRPPATCCSPRGSSCSSSTR